MSPITFFVMGQKGHAALAHYLQCFGAASVARVVGARDASVQQDHYDQIQALCLAHGVTFADRRTPLQIDTAYCIAIAWRWLIDAGSARLIVLHDSLLPRYRGFAPLVNGLINGEPELGVTALFASAEYDRGDVIAQERMAVAYPITIAEAIDRVSACYCALVATIGRTLATGGPIQALPQDERQASYSLWRDEDDYAIDWHDAAPRIRRFIDAVGFPYQGASTSDGSRLLRVLAAAEQDDVAIENRSPGKVIFQQAGQPVVVCGRGLLRLTRVIDAATGEDVLPLQRFRVRFRSP